MTLTFHPSTALHCTPQGSARVLQCLALCPARELPEGGKLRAMRDFREALEGMLKKQENLVRGGGGSLHPRLNPR